MKPMAALLALFALSAPLSFGLQAATVDMDSFRQGLATTLNSTLLELRKTRCDPFDHDAAWNEYCDDVTPAARPCRLSETRQLDQRRCPTAAAVHLVREAGQKADSPEAFAEEMEKIFSRMNGATSRWCGDGDCPRDASICDRGINGDGICQPAETFCSAPVNAIQCLATGHLFLVKTRVANYVHQAIFNGTPATASAVPTTSSAVATTSSGVRSSSMHVQVNKTHPPAAISTWVIVGIAIVSIVIVAFGVWLVVLIRRRKQSNAEHQTLLDHEGQRRDDTTTNSKDDDTTRSNDGDTTGSSDGDTTGSDGSSERQALLDPEGQCRNENTATSSSTMQALPTLEIRRTNKIVQPAESQSPVVGQHGPFPDECPEEYRSPFRSGNPSTS